MKIEGIPEGWYQERVGQVHAGEYWVNNYGLPELWGFDHPSTSRNYVIICKIEKPKQYRPFASAAEYVLNRREGIAVDWNLEDFSPGFFAVVSANGYFVWVAFGDVIKRFGWSEAFEKLKFRHVDNSTSPFGIEVTE